MILPQLIYIRLRLKSLDLINLLEDKIKESNHGSLCLMQNQNYFRNSTYKFYLKSTITIVLFKFLRPINKLTIKNK